MYKTVLDLPPGVGHRCNSQFLFVCLLFVCVFVQTIKIVQNSANQACPPVWVTGVIASGAALELLSWGVGRVVMDSHPRSFRANCLLSSVLIWHWMLSRATK